MCFNQRASAQAPYNEPLDIDLLWFLRAMGFATCLGSRVHRLLALQADSKGDIATMIALQGVLKFNGGGAARGFLSCGDVLMIDCLLYFCSRSCRPCQPQHLLDQPAASQGTAFAILRCHTLGRGLSPAQTSQDGFLPVATTE